MSIRLAITPDRPNLTLSLSASFNPRRNTGYTSSITDDLDQRKVNEIYKIITNAGTGKQTIYVCKRPGVTDVGPTYGVSSQTAYLWEVQAGAQAFSSSTFLVFSVSGNDIRSISNTSTTLVTTLANYVPAFVDKTHLSGVENLVLQIRRGSDGDQLAYFTTSGAYTQIVDGDFTGLTHTGKMEYMDGYAFIMDAATNSIFNSDLNSIANWTATNFIRKQIVQDQSQGIAKLGNQLIGLGSFTMEVFRNAGLSSGSPLETIPQLAQRVGIAAAMVDTHYYAELGGRIYWYGQGPSAGVYAYNGSRAEKVSTPAVENIFLENQPTYVGKMSIGGQAGVVFALDARTANPQRWMIFFPEWNDWFEWSSGVFQPITSTLVPSFAIGAGSSSHKLYQVSSGSDNWQDEGVNYAAVHQFEIPSNGNYRRTMHMAGLLCDRENSPATTIIQFSDDQGQNWTASTRTIDRTSLKPHTYRCGSFNRRLVRLTNTMNFEGRMEKFLARIE